jgi:histidine phosphotransfer protein HptB
MVDPELDELRREFLAEAAEKVREIEEAVESATFDRVTYLAHQLKGSGGSYGFKRISSVAAELEKSAEKFSGGDSAKLRECAGSLRDEIEQRARELGAA